MTNEITYMPFFPKKSLAILCHWTLAWRIVGLQLRPTISQKQEKGANYCSLALLSP